MNCVVVTSHVSAYPDPIRLQPGDRLKLGRRDPEYPGWQWVETEDGHAGWAPETLIEVQSQERGVATQAYTARELETEVGDQVRCTRELLGWLWVEHADGRTGWIPKKTVRPIE